MTAMLRTHPRGGLFLVTALLAGACSDGGSGPPQAASITAAGTIATSAAVASTVAPAALVADSRGRPLPGVAVTFEVTSGGGSVANASATTDQNGVAAAGAWTLGTSTGQNRLVARHGSLPPLTFTVNGTAGPVVSISALSAVDQIGVAGQPVGQDPSVRAVDQYDNPVPGLTVSFAVTSGGGSLSGATRITDAAGTATVDSWTLGATTGANTVTATYSGGNIVTFNATGNPAGPVLEKFAGDGTTCPVDIAGCVFAVRFTVDGQPTAGETVTWSNGTANTITTTTDARGIAWTGNIPPNSTTGARTQTATLESTSQQVTFDYTLVAGGGYDIQIRYIGSTPTAAVQAAFDQAVARWEEVITGDLQDILLQADSADCQIDHPAIDETIDDLLVLVEVDSIDGPLETLGAAGPCYIRNADALPVLGVMRLDSADLAALATNGRLGDVILHELGHTLGFPVLWDVDFFDLLVGAGTSNPYYTGLRARPSFVLAGGTLINGIGVPVENTGGAGTRDSHWRESVLSNELMTGFIGSNNPLSTITIGSLLDLGYQVNFGAADAYMLPGAGMFAVRAPSLELRELSLPRPRIAH